MLVVSSPACKVRVTTLLLVVGELLLMEMEKPAEGGVGGM